MAAARRRRCSSAVPPCVRLTVGRRSVFASDAVITNVAGRALRTPPRCVDWIAQDRRHRRAGRRIGRRDRIVGAERGQRAAVHDARKSRRSSSRPPRTDDQPGRGLRAERVRRALRQRDRHRRRRHRRRARIVMLRLPLREREARLLGEHRRRSGRGCRPTPRGSASAAARRRRGHRRRAGGRTAPCPARRSRHARRARTACRRCARSNRPSRTPRSPATASPTSPCAAPGARASPAT